MAKQISLTQGKVALVDDEDFERINAHKWFAHKSHSGKFYAARSVGTWPFQKKIYMAREIMNAPSGVEVDHKHSDNTLDNRKSNLRVCNHSDNRHNVAKFSSNTSGYKGVSWASDCRKWRARIEVNGKSISLGLFDDPSIAAKAYDSAALMFHGEFANTNF